MTQIKISIDCGSKYCGWCCFRTDIRVCAIFKEDLERELQQSHDLTPYEVYKRCPQCLAATVEE